MREGGWVSRYWSVGSSSLNYRVGRENGKHARASSKPVYKTETSFHFSKEKQIPV
jgi:hypothetical protein